MEAQFTNGFAELTTAKQDSVEISRNAKGEVSYTVKSYGETVDQAKEQALKAFMNLSSDLGK